MKGDIHAPTGHHEGRKCRAVLLTAVGSDNYRVIFGGVTMNSVHPEGRKCRAIADWNNPTLTATGARHSERNGAQRSGVAASCGCVPTWAQSRRGLRHCGVAPRQRGTPCGSGGHPTTPRRHTEESPRWFSLRKWRFLDSLRSLGMTQIGNRSIFGGDIHAPTGHHEGRKCRAVLLTAVGSDNKSDLQSYFRRRKR